MSNEIKISFVTALSALGGSVIGAGSILWVNWMTLNAEISKTKINAVIQEKNTFQTKTEEFLGNMSDLITFFYVNHSFEPKEASKVLGEIRKSAFKIMPYASKELTENFIISVEAVQLAIDSSNQQDLQKSIQLLLQSINQMKQQFYLEMTKYDSKINTLTKD